MRRGDSVSAPQHACLSMSQSVPSMFSKAPADRISRYGRTLVLFVILAIVIVASLVIVADRFGSDSISSLILQRPGASQICNKVLGARILFWLLLLADISTFGMVATLRSSKTDIEAYRAASAFAISDKQRNSDGTLRLRLKLSAIALIGISYWGSFHLAFGDQRMCFENYVSIDVVNYGYIILVNAARGLSLLLIYQFYFLSPSHSR